MNIHNTAYILDLSKSGLKDFLTYVLRIYEDSSLLVLLSHLRKVCLRVKQHLNEIWRQIKDIHHVLQGVVTIL